MDAEDDISLLAKVAASPRLGWSIVAAAGRAISAIAVSNLWILNTGKLTWRPYELADPLIAEGQIREQLRGLCIDLIQHGDESSTPVAIETLVSNLKTVLSERGIQGKPLRLIHTGQGTVGMIAETIHRGKGRCAARRNNVWLGDGGRCRRPARF